MLKDSTVSRYWPFTSGDAASLAVKGLSSSDYRERSSIYTQMLPQNSSRHRNKETTTKNELKITMYATTK